MLLARLKPYNEKKRHLTRTYMFDGERFFESRGWYQVPEDMGEKLRKLHQDYHDDDSPYLFDVCTEAEAAALEARELAKEEPATVRRPQPVRGRSTTAREEERGDMKSADVATPVTPPTMVDPDPEGDELAASGDDEGRVKEVGRVPPPPASDRPGPRQRQRSK